MEKKDKIDLTFKIISVLGIAFSFFYGLHRYEVINEDESAKAFWIQQFPIYKDLCSNASIIATSTDSIAVSNSINNFWRMYYGEAQMVIDQNVHDKLSSFAGILNKVERKEKGRDELIFYAFELSTECRISLAKSWNIPLSELTKG